MEEQKAREEYNAMLDEMYPLEGIHCNPFSILLAQGDPIAYDCGFNDWCDAMGYEIEEEHEGKNDTDTTG